LIDFFAFWIKQHYVKLTCSQHEPENAVNIVFFCLFSVVTRAMSKSQLPSWTTYLWLLLCLWFSCSLG